MKTWDYGDEGRKHPVRDGQGWKIGEHLFVCSDLMESRDFDEEIRQATLVYCDPPWGQSLVNSFRTKAGLAHATYRWEDLYRRIALIGHVRSIPVWVEGSKIDSRDGRKIPDTLKGAQYTAYASIVYYRKNPCGLYYSGPESVPAEILAQLNGRDDDDTPGLVMAAYGATGVVLDPCAGRGVTSRAAQALGWGSVNNELNPLRVSAALSRMAAMTGLEPRRVW